MFINGQNISMQRSASPFHVLKCQSLFPSNQISLTAERCTIRVPKICFTVITDYLLKKLLFPKWLLSFSRYESDLVTCLWTLLCLHSCSQLHAKTIIILTLFQFSLLFHKVWRGKWTSLLHTLICISYLFHLKWWPVLVQFYAKRKTKSWAQLLEK